MGANLPVENSQIEDVTGCYPLLGVAISITVVVPLATAAWLPVVKLSAVLNEPLPILTICP
jgi:hypothetical protein